MADYADVKIKIRKLTSENYMVDLESTGPKEFLNNPLNPDILRWVSTGSADKDGELLFSHLFQSDQIKQGWAEICGAYPNRRIRLIIDDKAPELHALPWELLRKPETEYQSAQTLTTSIQTPFCRYLEGPWSAPKPIIQRPINMLVAIANPNNLANYGLSSIDVAYETQNIREALSHIPATDLKITFLQAPITLPIIGTYLQDNCHIFHLISHGVRKKKDKKDNVTLFLANEINQVAFVTPSQLAEHIKSLGITPQLIFLTSCESASTNFTNIFQGFAQKLVKAGVPSVIAMRDLVSREAARIFTNDFYRYLFKHGYVDLACNQARSSVLAEKASESKIPVLFSRLKNNQLLDFETDDKQNNSDIPNVHEKDSNFYAKNIIFGNYNAIDGSSITITSTPSQLNNSLSIMFQPVYQQIDALLENNHFDKNKLKTCVQKIELEIYKGDKANITEVKNLLKSIKEINLDIYHLTIKLLKMPIKIIPSTLKDMFNGLQ